jgi:hypothetical protein
MSKKCYIAGKIGDLPKEIYEANFEKAEQEVIALGMIPVSPVKLPHNHNKSYEAYMCEDIAAMCQCHAVYALRNWRHSPGAKEEIRIATFVGKTVIHQQ